MGGFGSGRHGGTVTAEGTASYIIVANSLTRARLQMGHCATGTLHFGEERFAVEAKVDTTDPSDPFIELTHQTRDDREGDRIVRDRIRLIWTVADRGLHSVTPGCGQHPAPGVSAGRPEHVS
jgi:hypothetical protein